MFSNVCSGFSQSEFDNTQLSNSTIVPDSLHTGWYFFELESFEVEEDSDLEFEFCDIENPYWKSNIKFNSVELKKQQVDKVETEETSVTGETIKYPVAEAEDFGHLGNPNYVVTEWNESFQQNIVVVRNVCWLRFVKRFPLCSKGRYCVRLHMYLGADSNWPQTSDDHRTYVRIKKVVDAGATTLAEENMSSNIWDAVIRSYFDNSQLAHSTIVPDSLHTGWYFFELESFEVEEDSDLEFEFCDIENPYWKCNIKFNSVELMK